MGQIMDVICNYIVAIGIILVFITLYLSKEEGDEKKTTKKKKDTW